MWTLNCLRLNKMRGTVQQDQVDRTVGSLKRISMWSLSCHKAFWSSSAKTDRWIQGDSRSWCLYCCSAMAVADMSIFVSVPTLTRHDRDSGSSCHLGHYDVIGWPWQVMGVHCTERGVWARLCVHCFLKRTQGYYFPNITIARLFALALHISMTCCDLTQPTGIWI